jgi:hypothetical protein
MGHTPQIIIVTKPWTKPIPKQGCMVGEKEGTHFTVNYLEIVYYETFLELQ